MKSNKITNYFIEQKSNNFAKQGKYFSHQNVLIQSWLQSIYFNDDTDVEVSLQFANALKVCACLKSYSNAEKLAIFQSSTMMAFARKSEQSKSVSKDAAKFCLAISTIISDNVISFREKLWCILKCRKELLLYFLGNKN